MKFTCATPFHIISCERHNFDFHWMIHRSFSSFTSLHLKLCIFSQQTDKMFCAYESCVYDVTNKYLNKKHDPELTKLFWTNVRYISSISVRFVKLFVGIYLCHVPENKKKNLNCQHLSVIRACVTVWSLQLYQNYIFDIEWLSRWFASVVNRNKLHTD